MNALLITAGIITLGMVGLFAIGLGITALLELADRYLFPRGDR